MNISSLKEGDVLYDVHKERMGNTMMKRTGVWLVKIIEVNLASFTASWNGNPPRKYYRVPSSWKKRKPFIIESANTLGQRVARREEVKNARKIKERIDMFVVERVHE